LYCASAGGIPGPSFASPEALDSPTLLPELGVLAPLGALALLSGLGLLGLLGLEGLSSTGAGVAELGVKLLPEHEDAAPGAELAPGAACAPPA
jgi:hypothetical protein